VPALVSISVGLVLNFVVPVPAGVSPQAWQLLSIFLSTIVGLVLSPLPVGAWAFCALTVCIATKTLTFQQAFSAFLNDVIWLIVISFFFARGFVKTGLGNRVATYFVKWLGKSTLGLAYGLAFSEALICPAMPSTTARAGGVFGPIIRSLALASGSRPDDGSAGKLGRFLVQAQIQGSCHSSALFLTAAAQNLLCLKLAESLGVVVISAWTTWFVVACVPAVVGLLLTPYLVYKLLPPEIKETPDAPAIADQRLAEMGPPSTQEKMMVATMGGAVALWVFGDALGVSSVLTAMIGLCALLVTGVLQWQDCLKESAAWDTLLWFAVLVGMSAQLNSMGLVSALASWVSTQMSQMSLGWGASFALLNVAYFGAHYLFASQTAHVGSLYAAFLAMALAAGAPPVLAAIVFAINSNAFGSITHYSSGQSAIYYGQGYVSLKDTFRVGAICGVFNILLWAIVGGLWWGFLGYF